MRIEYEDKPDDVKHTIYRYLNILHENLSNHHTTILVT